MNLRVVFGGIGIMVGVAWFESELWAQAVSQLEAIHVAEIHTGVAVESVELHQTERGKAYRVRSAGGWVLVVDGDHGRLLKRSEGPSEYEWPGIRVVAHRGGVLLGPPENTLPAIEKAIAVGADLIEIDIRQTVDGDLVLMHDATVNRTTNGSGAVTELSRAEIARLEVIHEGTEVIRVPGLGEALALMKGRIDADLDFKGGDLGKLVAAVRAAGMEDHATIHASWERCQRLTGMEPRIRIRPTVQHSGQVRDLVQRLRPAMVNFDWHAVTEQSVRDAHLSGALAFVNCLETADTDLYVREAIRIGADYIQSDRPDRVIAILRELGLRPDKPILGSRLGTPLRDPKLRYPLR